MITQWKRQISFMPVALFLLLLLFAGCRGNALEPGTAQNTTAPASWSTFEDPMEHAFSVDVPRGWTVRGGLFRLGYSDERVMVDVRSPDGSTAIRLGDVAIPSYAMPTQYHSREGEVYDLGAQAKLIVAHYRTGPEFAVLYSQARFHELCRDPQADSADAGFAVPDYVPLEGTGETSAGQIAWRCTTPQGPQVVFAYTRTARTSGIWQAPTIVSFIAPPEKAALARSIALQMVRSFHLTAAWIEHQKEMDAEGLQYQRMRQQQRVAAIRQQVRQFEAQMQAMQNQVSAFESHQASQAAQVQSFTNALSGITPTTDPLTGDQRDVWTGTRANYWVNGLGQVVNSTDAPAAGWRQLQVQQ
jgi:hypothetical protein